LRLSTIDAMLPLLLLARAVLRVGLPRLVGVLTVGVLVPLPTGARRMGWGRARSSRLTATQAHRMWVVEMERGCLQQGAHKHTQGVGAAANALRSVRRVRPTLTGCCWP
jgi:hypothetical protein